MQTAYVLHTRRYGDSSLIAELLTREQGRVACMAKGALRARRAASRIESFQPLQVELRGRGEVLTLTRAESHGAPLMLKGRNLYCGLYLNELLLRLTAREDACPELFDDYGRAIRALAGEVAAEPTLRRFEVSMLSHLGLGLALEQDKVGRPIIADQLYTYDVHAGASPCTGEHAGSCSGRTLIALRTGSFGDETTLRQARQIMRRIIDFHLCGRALHSRELFR